VLASRGSVAGSVRASVTVEASGGASAELETNVAELDPLVPCADAALERTRFPATSAGRTHLVVDVSFAPPR
jgi:hypothetical protein